MNSDMLMNDPNTPTCSSGKVVNIAVVYITCTKNTALAGSLESAEKQLAEMRTYARSLEVQLERANDKDE